MGIYGRNRTHLSTADVAYVQGFCRNTTKDLTVLQRQISDLHTGVLESLRQLAQFLCVVTQRRAQVNAPKSLFAPIRLLPTEILTLIFEMSMRNEILDNRRSMRTSFHLTQVCKVWRDIATHTLVLWGSAYIDCAQIKAWPLETLENLTNIISERNHFKRLQVEIHDKPDIELEPLNYDLNSLLNKILRSTSSLFLIIHTDSFCRWLSHWDDGNFCNLRELSLVLTTRKRNDDIDLPQERFPHLTHVSVSVGYPSIILDILLPWENLEHLPYHFHLESSQFTTDLANSSVRVWGRTSNWCKSNLRSLELKFQQDLRPYSPRPSLTALVVNPVTLTNLTTLSVVNDFDGEVATIFDHVALPALEDLAYEAIAPCQLTLDSSDTPHMDMFLNIGRLKDTFSQLTRLSLLRVCIADSDILPLLRTLHTLVYFHLFNVSQWSEIKRTSGSNVDKPIDPSWTPEDAQLLRLLTVTPYGLDTTSICQQSKDVLLPRLTRIRLYYPCFLKNCQAHAQAYAALVRSHLEHYGKGSTLPDFHLTLSHSDSWVTISSLRTAMDLELGRARLLEHFTLERVRDNRLSREINRMEDIQADCESNSECNDPD